MTTETDCTAGLAPRRAYVQANGTRLAYLEWGAQGQPLVLLLPLPLLLLPLALRTTMYRK